jgi:nicotinamidase-related amidase
MTNSDFDGRSSALVLIDLQNDNVHSDGAYASTGAAAHAESQHLVSHVGELLRWARNTDVPVIHNRIVSYPGRDFGGSNAPIFRMIGPESLEVGTWGAAALDGLDAAPDEPVLLRTRMSCFNGNGLDAMLRSLAVTDVIVTGVWTNMAVEHTVRDAADFGYRPHLVTDATSSINDEWHQAAISYALRNIAEFTTTADVIAGNPTTAE